MPGGRGIPQQGRPTLQRYPGCGLDMMVCSVKHPCLKRPEGLKDTRLSGKCLSRLTKLGDWPVGVFLIRGLMQILKRFLH
jgi:hypothetical protein